MKWFAIFFLVSCLSGFSQTQKKKSVAVIEFQSTGMDKSESTTLTSRFRGMLVQTKAYNVIERAEMDEILKAQDFSLTDQCNTSECAIEVGKMLAVEQIIAGNIGKVGDTWTTDLRLIEISTGKIIQTQTGDYKGQVDGLLEVMRQIAYVFAGLKPPSDKTLSFQFNQPPRPPGRLKIDIALGNTGVTSSRNDVKSQIGGNASVGFMMTPRIRIAIEVGGQPFEIHPDPNIILPDSQSLGNSIGGDPIACEGIYGGISGTFYLSKDGFQPFVSAGFGIQHFKTQYSGFDANSRFRIKQYKSFIFDQVNITTGNYFYWSSGAGAEMELSRVVNARVLIRVLWTKPENLTFIGGGLVFKLGPPFHE